MGFLDNDCLDPGRELNVLRSLQPMTCHSVLQEVNAAVRVLPHFQANLIRGHPHQLLTHSLLPESIEAVREGLEKSFASLREKILSEWPPQSGDVSREINPCTRSVARSNLIASLAESR